MRKNIIHRRRGTSAGVPYIILGVLIFGVAGYIGYSVFITALPDTGIEKGGEQYGVEFSEPEPEDIIRTVSENGPYEPDDPGRARAIPVFTERLLGNGYRAVSADFEGYKERCMSTMSDKNYPYPGSDHSIAEETGRMIVECMVEAQIDCENQTEQDNGDGSYTEYADMLVTFHAGTDLDRFESLLGIDNIELYKEYVVPVKAVVSRNGSDIWNIDEISFTEENE